MLYEDKMDRVGYSISLCIKDSLKIRNKIIASDHIHSEVSIEIGQIHAEVINLYQKVKKI